MCLLIVEVVRSALSLLLTNVDIRSVKVPVTVVAALFAEFPHLATIFDSLTKPVPNVLVTSFDPVAATSFAT